MSRSVINPGEFYLWTGCMSSGKTLGLITDINDKKHVPGAKILLGKPDSDIRSEGVLTRLGNLEMECIKIPHNNAYAILRYVRPEHKVVAIDEIHFFNNESSIVDVIQELQHRGLNILASGLDLDFRGEPFNEMPSILAIADYVEKTHAVCTYEGCGNFANRTQRLIDGNPAPYDSELIVTGNAEGSDKGNHITYVPRCLEHHFVPRN